MGRIGDKRSPEEIQADLEAKRRLRMANTNALAFDLLDHGFNVWIDMQQITSHGDFYSYIVIDSDELGGERFDEAMLIANAHGAHAALKEIRMNQTSFTRLAFWPAGTAD